MLVAIRTGVQAVAARRESCEVDQHQAAKRSQRNPSVRFGVNEAHEHRDDANEHQAEQRIKKMPWKRRKSSPVA